MKRCVWLFAIIACVAFWVFILTGIAWADVFCNVSVKDGNIKMSSSVTGSSDLTTDKYYMKLRAPFVREAIVKHSITDMVETEIVATSDFLVSTICYKEAIGMAAGNDSLCFSEAAGATFKATNIEFSSIAGGTGTGIGYIADSPIGVGDIKFKYAQEEAGLAYSELIEGEDPTIIDHVYSAVNYEIGVRGTWVDFYAAVEPPITPPAAMIENDIMEWQKPWICPWVD